MSTFSVVVLGLAIIFNFGMTFVMHTDNVRSAILFKIIPFAIAVGLAVVIFIELGMIVQMPTGG